MPRLIITGGRAREISVRDRDEWSRYDEARIAELDTERGDLACRLRYVGPPDRVPEREPSHVFKAGSWDGGELWVPTQTEILRVDPGRWRVSSTVSHPWFNDLHHAVAREGRLYAVSTGLDCLLALDGAGEVSEVRHALGDNPWGERRSDVDYRRVATTKPHAAHPNYVFFTEAGTWLTRFEQEDAVCLDRPELRVAIDVGRPHDGLESEGALWFTTVNGHVVQAEPSSGAVIARYDLTAIEGSGEPLGWCRGLALVDGIAYVGFSRIRYTKLRRNLSWLKHRFQTLDAYRTLPTRVVAYRLPEGRKLGEWIVEPAGIDAIFSLLATP